PWSGKVLIDGVPRDQIAADVLSSSLGFVEQQVVLFSGSTMDNLTLWDRSITRDRAVAAARDAAIDDVIASRPGGYDGLIEEEARNISGGQAQRLEIARALTFDPTILVLDEATSALDAATEVEIDNAIRRRGCTTVIVAHRLSTIRDADLILVLDQGRVVEHGTHDDLIANGGLYHTLVHA
ncbi:MAG: ATP-binding cassette domain-containing protein, partial [Actinomycetes bacterium]